MGKDSPIVGHWRITHTEDDETDYVDEEVEAYIRFEYDGRGGFQFGYVSGSMLCTWAEREGRPAVE